MAKVWLCLFSIAVLFGQDDTPVKAGDRAPEIDWTDIVQSPQTAPARPNLAGQYTVLHFVPNVTANPQAIGSWNDLIAKFTAPGDKPIQFVWIASERWSAVEPFLREHPMNSYLLVDEKNEAALAYGCRMEENALIDPSGNIVGFAQFLFPEQLLRVLDGKARLDTVPHGLSPRLPVKPDIPPSYTVHISPSKTEGTAGSIGPDYWMEKGFDLKEIVAMVYEKPASRVVLPKELDNGDKFDFVLALPKQEDKKTIHQLVQRAIEKYFKVSVSVELRPAEVYVMTAIKGKTPPAKTGAESLGGGISSVSGFNLSLPAGTANTPEAFELAVQEMLNRPEYIGISQISANNMTTDDFRKLLENGMGRPIIDETGLEGVYDFEVHGGAKNTEEFIRNLREQAGLVLTPTTKIVEYLTLQRLF